MTIVKLYKDMFDQQRQLIERNGFGGLLNFAFSQVHPELCNWLLTCYDAESSELVFPGRGSIPVTESSVHKVLGIPMGAKIIDCKLDSAATTLMKQLFPIHQGNQPKISHILNFLKGYKSANNKYLKLWTLLAASSLLVPTFSTKVSSRLYRAVTDATAICNKNWCELVVRVLREKLQSGSKKHGFKSCLTFLMILYLDALQTGFKKISDTGCRITIWTNKFIKRAIDADTKPDDTFGALQLKPQFTVQDSMFLARSLHLDSFINNQVPESFGPQERLKAKAAVEKICSGLSKLVTNFLQDFYQAPSASNNQAFGGEAPHNEEFVGEQEEELEDQEDEFVDETESEGSQESEASQEFNASQEASHEEAEEEIAEEQVVQSSGTESAEENADKDDHCQAQGKGDDTHKLHEINEVQGFNDVSDEALGSDDARAVGVSTQGSIGSYVSLCAPTQLTQGPARINHDDHLGGATSLSDVSGSFQPMHIGTTYIDTVSIQDYESDLAKSVSKLKDLNRKGEVIVFKSGGSRDTKIAKVQTNNADGTRRSTTSSYMDNDVQQPAPLEVEYPAQDLAHVLSFKCTAPTNGQEAAAPSASTGTITSVHPLDFDPPSFDLGISDMSSQEKASQEPVVAANIGLNLAQPLHTRKLQLPRAAKSDGSTGIRESSVQTVPAIDLAGVLHAGSAATEATGANKFAPIFVGSESQEHGLQQDDPILVQSQGQGQQTQEDGLQYDDPILVQSQSQGDFTQQDDLEQSNPILVHSQSQVVQSQSFITPAGVYIQPAYIPDEILLELDALITAKQANEGITPVPHVRHERVTKSGPAKRSPYINYSQKLSYELSKSDKEAYSKIIRFGRGNRSKKNSAIIVNYGTVHTSLGDFADSLKPKGQLSNETADCILHILRDQPQAKSKCVLSHRIATFALAGDLQRTEMKSSFSFDKRLDHYNLLFFPVLEVNVTTELKHWFVIVVNFKAQCFELMDSLRGQQDKDLLETSNKIISNIKILWKQHHAKSKIDISQFKSLYIDAPKQESTVDCGYYMLKYIEYWDGKTVPQIHQSDMYNIRVNYMSKMLHWKGNLVTWHQVIK
ncbi:unnamed protein product [Urochloa decumbens]|uniref:Ubiquitin-like protease family profile domain-containing protein n=1 Tax=Urochloa decumbens TaxID=240449 RepID=A0ABC9AGC9_9POAL